MAFVTAIRHISIRARAGDLYARQLTYPLRRCLHSSIPLMSWEDSKVPETLRAKLDAMVTAGTLKNERVIYSAQGVHIKVRNPSQNASLSTRNDVLNFCANNYLGLANHPRLVEAAKRALDSHGVGCASVRFICGTQDLHKDLEQKIAAFHEQDQAILFPSCFDANGGLFEAILDEEDAVFSDELNHASIIDGIRLCKAQRHRYKHNNMEDLERQLKENKAKSRIKLIVTDGVFSMDGDYARLKELRSLADRYQAILFVDDCHATGFVGRKGRGTAERAGIMTGVDIVSSTLGKAMGGSQGGYIAARADIVNMLRQKARPYLFSNSIAPSLVAASIEAYDMLTESTELRDRLFANTAYFRQKITSAGFRLASDSDHPIVAIMLGDAKLAGVFAEEMLTRGIYVIAFSYPVVPKEKARIRVQISAAHTKGDLDKAAEAFIDVGRLHNVIS